MAQCQRKPLEFQAVLAMICQPRLMPKPDPKTLSQVATLTCAAAVAVPITNAAIVYDASPNVKVGFSSGFGGTWTLDLPGTVDLQLQRLEGRLGYYAVQAKGAGAGYLRVRSYKPMWGYPFAKRGSAGMTWSNIGGNVGTRGIMGLRTSTSWLVGPGSFSDKYVTFKFQDSTQGNADRYGWLKLSMAISGRPSASWSGPDVTLKGWGYDTTGAKIAMGAVPEPASAAAGTGAALVLGAAGVRAWRKRQAKADLK
jgi:hypothetical protein